MTLFLLSIAFAGVCAAIYFLVREYIDERCGPVDETLDLAGFQLQDQKKQTLPVDDTSDTN